MNDFDTARAQFMARAAAPDVSANVLKLAYVIAFKHMNVESMTAVVGQGTLAADLNVTVRTVQNLLPVLQGFGLVIERGVGRNKLSVFRIGSVSSESKGANAMSPFDAEKAKRTASFDAETAKPNSLFPELTPPPFRMEVRWTLEQLLGYFSSWSATNRFIKAKGYNPLESLRESLAKHWGDPSSPRLVQWPLTLRLCRKAKH